MGFTNQKKTKELFLYYGVPMALRKLEIYNCHFTRLRKALLFLEDKIDICHSPVEKFKT